MDLLQWPAMAVTVAAAYLVASRSARRRRVGFWLFLASNVLWVAWGWYASAFAPVVLQLALAAMNVRGAWKNEGTTAGRSEVPSRWGARARQ